MAAPFSLRPWPTGNKKPKNLGEFIARVNAERPGGFRSLDQFQLREQIKSQEEGRADGSSDGEFESEDDSEDNTKTTQVAKVEFLRNAEVAHQSVMMCLDFVSLLLSRETPVQASLTLSQELRNYVGIGTLGATVVKDSNITPARHKNDLAVATGWRVMGINKMVDSVVSAADRLEKEISLETKYWADVLAVSENGWSVSPLPHEQATLGVRFGFAEAAPGYRDNSVAPLRRNDDGTVRLAHGRVGGGSQRVRVTIEKEGKITGRSSLPGRTAEKAPLQYRVLEARNSIFSQELWHEINREARVLLPLGVRSDSSRVTYDMDTKTKLILTLEDLSGSEDTDGLPDSDFAEAITLGLHLLLSNAHRQNYNRRTQFTQSTSIRSPYNILCPIIMRFKYNAAYFTLTHFLTELTAVLNRAGVSTASFSHSMSPISLISTQKGPRRVPKSEVLFHSLLHDLDSKADLTITPEIRMIIHGKGFMEPFVQVPFKFELPGESNVLREAYPPLNQDPFYPDVSEAIRYVRQAVICGLTHKYATLISQRRDDVDWNETLKGVAITNDRKEREARIDIGTDNILVLTVEVKDGFTKQWSWGRSDFQEKIEDIIIGFFQSDN